MGMQYMHPRPGQPPALCSTGNEYWPVMPWGWRVEAHGSFHLYVYVYVADKTAWSLSCRSDESVVKLGIRRITVVSFTLLTYVIYFLVCRGRAAADFSESESEVGVLLRRRRCRNQSTETLTYAANGDWDGSQCTLSQCTRHAAGFVLRLLQPQSVAINAPCWPHSCTYRPIPFSGWCHISSGGHKLAKKLLTNTSTVCIWFSWCHCFPKPYHLLPHLNPDWFTFLVPAYPGCPGKRPLNGCSSSNS